MKRTGFFIFFAVLAVLVTGCLFLYVLEVPEAYPNVFVRFEDPSMIYAAEYHDDVPAVIFMLTPGAAIVVPRGASGIDAVLHPIP